MTSMLSPNTQTILLLTAPLIAGRGVSSSDLLSPGEYKRLARHLRDIKQQPADLVSSNAADVLRACQSVIEESRLQRLLGRGFLLSQVVERWQARAIWVVSRADPGYPRRLKALLREDSPAVLYGCGNMGLLETGGLAVVGSRHVDDSLIDYTMTVGRLTACAGRTLVSGGAKGIDQAAMRGALEAGGMVSGVLADSLEKTAMNRENRNLLLDGQLVLISPYDPSAGFNVGHAMQRNKLIYALADAALVVSSDHEKGGTWSGAIEQLDRLRFVPVYVRSTGKPSVGLDALRNKGASPWPNPQDADSLETLFESTSPVLAPLSQRDLPLFTGEGSSDVSTLSSLVTTKPREGEAPDESVPLVATPFDEPLEPTRERAKSFQENEVLRDTVCPARGAALTPADALFALVKNEIQLLLKVPMKDTEVAIALDVSVVQAKAWLLRLVNEGVIEKQKKPIGYIAKLTSESESVACPNSD